MIAESYLYEISGTCRAPHANLLIALQHHVIAEDAVDLESAARLRGSERHDVSEAESDERPAFH